MQASLSGEFKKDWFQKHIYKLGRDEQEGKQPLVDVDCIRDYYDETIVAAVQKNGIRNFLKEDTLAVYNENHDIREINKDEFLSGLRIIFTDKYEILKRNKESLSKKIKNKRRK